MAYATRSDFTDRRLESELQRIGDPDRTGTVNETLVTAALEDGASFIDACIAVRYSLTAVQALSPVPNVLILINCDIAAWLMAFKTPPISKEIKERYEAAMKWLAQVKDGKVTIPGADGALSTQVPEFQSEEALYTRETMAGLL